jgi:transcription initiation factor IIE alpha subunit
MPNKPEPDFDQDELLTALEELQSEPGAGPGFTTAEICERTGMHKRIVHMKLKALKQAGRLQVHRVMRESVDGIQRRVSAYSIRPS